MEKLEQTPMSDKHWHEKLVASRLREHAETVMGVLVRQDIRQGAIVIEQLIAERPKAWNEAIDACIEIFRSAPWDQNIIPLVEKLKHKQP